jgi:uncharacterized membrane protein (DUF485 family)
VTATERPSPPEYPGGSGDRDREDRDWEEIAASPEFQELRHRLRSFVFPMTGLFLAWYLLYVLLASYAPAFMAVKLVGNINVGLVFGLLQFVSTFAITFLYVRFADRKLDPLAGELRSEIEGGHVEDGHTDGRDAVDGRDTAGRDIAGRDIEEGVK